MNEPLENLYFNWLCIKVLTLGDIYPSSPQVQLLRILHQTEFVWLLSGDDNRAEDGKALREEFLLYADLPDNIEWKALGCSLLEMLIAFSRRAEFTVPNSARDWFWEFMENLGLSEFHDVSKVTHEYIDEILETVIWRTYAPNGCGGLFPLTNPKKDQREVQIWYQFNEYIDEKYP